MKFIIRPKAERFIQKSDKELKEKIKSEFRKIFEDPFKNYKLKPPLSPMRTHHFFYKKVQYRIAYIVENNVVVILIGTRENFYKRFQ